MATELSRRGFIQGSLAVGGMSLVSGLKPLSAKETELDSRTVQFHPEIESLVRFIEETPRGQLLEEAGTRVRRGLSYRELLAALLLAGIRNVQPRPSVGFKFHAVLVVNSAHIASLSSPDQDRWLPIFWALDGFKNSQERDVREGNWTMAAVKESEIPSPENVRTVFHESMQNWNVPRADVAAAGLARYVGATDVLELFAGYAARDFRSIGHKAIYVANAWRTLQTIGWHHSEPILRSLSYALLNHNGEANPSKNDLAPDRPWRRNQQLAPKIRENWLAGKIDSVATNDLLKTLRSGSADDAADAVVDLLNRGISPQSILDAFHVGAGELLVRQAGIVALHAVTTTNAIRFLFDNTGNDETRKLLLLQNAAFLTLFREAMRGRGKVADVSIDDINSSQPTDSAAGLITKILADISGQRRRAAEGVLGYLDAGFPAQDLINQARRMIFLKGSDAHDYKFSSAALEDYFKISPEWRNRFLATSVYNLKGSRHKNNGIVERIRSATRST